MMEKSLKKKGFLVSCLCCLALAVCLFFYWLFVWRWEEYTNDAYVHGNQIELTPQVPGTVSAIYTEDTHYVEEGQVLLRLDDTNFSLAFDKACAELGEMGRQVQQKILFVEQLKADLLAKEADLIRANQDLANRLDLVAIGGVAKEQFEHTETTLARARAEVESAKFALERAYAEVGNTTLREHPLVVKGIEQVRQAWVNWKRCSIISPVSGYVAMRSVQLGEWVTPKTPLLSIIPLGEIWVDANFKETQISQMRVGQDVYLRSDLYGREVVFHGKLIGINPGTGNVFSLLPPQNATGNWIKIVQRVPIRIGLKPEEIQRHPLWLGLSMKVWVDIASGGEHMFSQKIENRPLYETPFYAFQQEGVEPMIEEILASIPLGMSDE